MRGPLNRGHLKLTMRYVFVNSLFAGVLLVCALWSVLIISIRTVSKSRVSNPMSKYMNYALKHGKSRSIEIRIK